jgi:hypothetical protein
MHKVHNKESINQSATPLAIALGRILPEHPADRHIEQRRDISR